jgi:DNA mismatch repair protein MutS
MNNSNIYKSLDILGKVDYLYSIATLVRNHGYNFTEYIPNRKTPGIFMKNFFHPSIPNVVKNTIDIGMKSNRNIVLTGPNAGGKSTLIKTLSVSVLLAQTLGIAPAEKMYLTPFHYVNTYLNIYDVKGKKSLFENEMERISTHIKRLKTLKPTEFAFIIIDELFSGTNPKEGIASSIAIGEKLATYSNSITVITTHYTQLTELKNYSNYKMDINRDNGKLNFTYLLKAGVSTDYIAVDLLKDNKFDKSIVDKANEIKNRK